MLDWLHNLDLMVIKGLINVAIAFFSGFLIGATEIISTFQYRRKLFTMPSVIIFLSLHGLIGLLAFILLTYQDASYWGNILAAFAAGVSPHVILRSRFSIFRSRDETGAKKLDVGLDLERVFNAWVNFFKNRIDVIFLQDQRKLIDRLIAKYPTTQAMRQEAVKLLYTRQALKQEERTSKLDEIEKIFQDAKDLKDAICLHRLADLIVKMSDFDTLNEILSRETKDQTLDTQDAFLKDHPNFLDQLETWKAVLSDREWQYLNDKILASPLTDKGKAKAAAKFLQTHKKLADVIKKLETQPDALSHSNHG